MLYRLSLLAIFSLVGLTANAQPGPGNGLASPEYAGTAPRHASWDKLAQLGGSWRLANPKSTAEKAFRIRMRPISKITAMLETFGNPAGLTTETVYHRDGENIMATHYCAQGNQPRLLLTPTSTPGTLSFRFHDITNLTSKANSHLIRLDFKLIDDDNLERRETYTQNGITEESVLRLTRVW